jgi:hypothetical protein
MVRDTADDDEWLEALRSGDSSKHRDAALVKRALMAHAHRLSAEVPVADDHLYTQLRFRLRLEKLLKDGLSAANLAAVAASVVGVAVITLAFLPDRRSDDYSSVRSIGDGQGIPVADPELEAQNLVARLKAAGIPARLERSQERVVVVVPASLDAIESLEHLKVRSSKAGDHLQVIYRKQH